MTSALITRAKLGQCVSIKPITIPLKPPPSTKAIRISVTRCGTLRNRSITHVMRRSVSLPIVAAAIPSTSAIKALPTAPSNPTPILSLRPIIVRANISRPSQSVPNRCSNEGERLRSVRLVAILLSSIKVPPSRTLARNTVASIRISSVRCLRLSPKRLTLCSFLLTMLLRLFCIIAFYFPSSSDQRCSKSDRQLNYPQRQRSY